MRLYNLPNPSKPIRMYHCNLPTKLLLRYRRRARSSLVSNLPLFQLYPCSSLTRWPKSDIYRDYLYVAPRFPAIRQARVQLEAAFQNLLGRVQVGNGGPVVSPIRPAADYMPLGSRPRDDIRRWRRGCV